MNKLASKYKALSKVRKIVMWVIVGVLIVGIGVGSYFAGAWLPENRFNRLVEKNDIWQNDLSTRIPQIEIYDIMYNHIVNNESGKTPKLLFLGYDGCLASVVRRSKGKDYSAIYNLLDDGGKIYLGRAGGETVGDQQTSTAPGWSSIFTGHWATDTGVKTNGDILSEDTRSIIYTLGEMGYSASFSVSWATHFEVTYSKEISSAEAKGYDIKYTLSNGDDGTIQAVKDSIASDRTATFCTLEFTDHQGHATGFNDEVIYVNAFKDLEKAANGVLDEVFARPTYAQEDWMIIIASDHGGQYMFHGGTTNNESTTFFLVYHNN